MGKTRRRAMAAIGMLASTTALAAPAFAQDATWSANPDTVTFGNRSDYQNPANWANGAVPGGSGTATFGASNGTNIFFENQANQQPLTIGRFVFTAAAPAYTFTLASDDFSFTGEGIVNNSAATQTIIVGNRSFLRFRNTSSAGNATLRAFGSQGQINFDDNSSAAQATIVIGLPDTGAGGSGGRLEFRDNSTAGSATITNPFGNVIFLGNSTAGNATINNQFSVIFSGASNLGAATINNGNYLQIFGNASGGNATVINNAGATVDISAPDGSAAGTVIGSLSGAGRILLGNRTLTLGGLNRNETISGAITDGGDLGGAGGSLTKTGTGALTLSGANSYTGATSVNQGALLLTGSITGAGQTGIGFSPGANGQLTIQAGGTLNSTGSAIIGGFGGNGTVLVTGAGSRWTMAGGLSIGLAPTGGASGGVGRLTIDNGGSVTSNGALLSGNRQDGSDDGRVIVTGTGSVWTSGALGMISTRPDTRLTIAAGATVNSTTANIAAPMLVTGPGSVWNSGALVVGPNLSANGTPRGNLTIAAGAVVNSTSAVVAEGGGLSSVVIVEGANSIWNISGDLLVARAAFDGASISLRNGGRMNVADGAGAVLLGTTGGPAFLTIGGGAPGTTSGTLNAASVQIGANAILSFEYAGNTNIFAPLMAGTGQIFAGSGTTILTADSSAFSGRSTIFAGATLQLGNNGGSGALGGAIVNNSQLIINRSGALTLAGIISGTGSFTHNGGGVTTLSAVNAYTGSTRINTGTLLVTGSIASSNLTSIFSGARLGGTGILGDVGVNSFGTLAPGLGIGALATRNLVLSPSSTLEIEVNGARQGDRLNVIGTVTLGAGSILKVLEIGAFDGANPFEYLIIDNDGSDPVSGTFGAIQNQFAFLTASVVYNGGDGNDVFLLLTPNNSTGVNARWRLNPGSSEWNTAANWDPVLVPTGTATFGPTGMTLVQVVGPSTIGTILFEANAPSYQIAVGSVNHSLTINGAGVVNNSAVPQTLSVGGRGTVTFTNSSTAANLRISAGNNQGLLRFLDMSSAGTSIITLSGLGFSGGVEFFGSSSAADATINIVASPNGQILAFHDSSTAGAATITNEVGSLIFLDRSSLGRARIANRAAMRIRDSADGPDATVTNDAGGTLDISAEPGAAAGVSIGTLTGAGNIFLGNRRLTLGGRDTSDTIGGVIADGGLRGGTGGGLTKIGAGALTLTGMNSYTGATRIDGGTLLVTGSIAPSAVTVASGGTLGGTGTAGATSILSGGALSPGLSIGTLAIAGNLSLAAGSNFLVEVGPAAADRVNVTGSATLAGTLTAISLGGTFTSGTQYTLLNATGGITGTFNQLVTQGTFGAGLAPTLSYNGNNVILTIGRTGPINTATTTFTDTLAFNAPTITVQRVSRFETRIIGRLAGGLSLFDQTINDAFGSTGVNNALAAARLAITTAGGPGVVVISDPVLVSRTVSSATSSASIFTLAGSSQNVTTVTTFGPATVTIGDARSCGAAIAALPSGSRPACGPPGGQTFTVEAGSVNINTNTRTDYVVNEARTDTITDTTRETYELTGTVVPVGTVHAAVQSALFDLGGRFLRRMSEEGAPARFGERDAAAGGASSLAPAGGGGAWAEFYGYRARADARGGAFAERRDARGLAGGVSLIAGEGLSLGLAVDRGWLDLAVPGSGEQADVEMTQLAASARLGSGPFSLGLAFAYGFGTIDSRRALGGIATAARYDVDLIGGAVEARYTIETGGLRLTPVAALDWARVGSEAFAETGAFGLAAPEASRSRIRAAFGLEAGTAIRFDGGARLDLAASGRYAAILSGEERSLPVAFNAAPGTALFMRGLPERDSAILGAQAAFHLTGRFSLYVAYDGRFAAGYDSHAALAGIRIGW